MNPNPTRPETDLEQQRLRSIQSLQSELSTLREELQRVTKERDAANDFRDVAQMEKHCLELRDQLAAREAGLTELGNELFDCKAQLKDVDDRLAARDEELRQAREETAQRIEEVHEWIKRAEAWQMNALEARKERDSLRAALVEAQEIGAREQKLRCENQAVVSDFHRLLRKAREFIPPSVLLEHVDGMLKLNPVRDEHLAQLGHVIDTLREALQSGGCSDVWCINNIPEDKRAGTKTNPPCSVCRALALTQTPNLYRELTERIKELEGLKFDEGDIKPLIIAIADMLEWRKEPRGFVREPLFNVIKCLRALMEKCEDSGIRYTLDVHHRIWDKDFKEISKLYFEPMDTSAIGRKGGE
jgi:hypothetical protein